MSTKTELATLAGGCFWCLEAVYKEVAGVDRVVSGYTGGDIDSPTYEQVCSESTGHAEAVQLTFDPEKVSYREVLDIFFAIHDPTTLDRQGPDVGTQYRSAVFHHDETQRAVAVETIRALEADHQRDGSIVTEVTPLAEFYPAEGYHQQYYRRNQLQGYCQVVISPKLAKFRRQFASKRS